MSVTTVMGKVNKNDLGIVTPHEHIYIDMSVFFAEPEEISAKKRAHEPVTMDQLGILKRNPFAVLDNVQMMDEDTQLNEIQYFQAAGGKTIVDVTNVGIGRDVELLKRAAVKTGMHIIAGSGFYVHDAQKPSVLSMTTEQMEAQIIKELSEGIGHTDVKAGVIGEIGVSVEMTEFERRSVSAACRAQRETSAPLIIHINPWSEQGRAAMQIVKQHNVDPKKVVICHSDVENREDYIFDLLDMGVYVEFDNFGKEMATDIWDVKPGSGRFVTDWQRVWLLKKMFERGYEDQILFSCDICLKSLLHAYGGWGYDHVLTHILPMLREVGVSQAQLEKVLIANPANWLDW